MKVFEPLPPETEFLAKAVVDSAYKVHSSLGPGLLESVYEKCVAHELRKQGISLQTQMPFPVVYDDIRLEVVCALICSWTSNSLSRLRP